CTPAMRRASSGCLASSTHGVPADLERLQAVQESSELRFVPRRSVGVSGNGGHSSDFLLLLVSEECLDTGFKSSRLSEQNPDRRDPADLSDAKAHPRAQIDVIVIRPNPNGHEQTLPIIRATWVKEWRESLERHGLAKFGAPALPFFGITDLIPS